MEEEIYYDDVQEQTEYTEDSYSDTEGESGGYEEDTGEESHEETLQEDVGEGEETDLHERIDSLLEQISTERDYGSMGDYYIKEIGCYAYPDADVFSHFVDMEAEGAGWAEASNGCYVRVEYLEDYESYISGSTGTDDGSGEGLEELPEEQEEPVLTVEDITGLKQCLDSIYEQDSIFYEAVTMHMEQTDAVMSDISSKLSIISCVLIVICVFLALIAGNCIANTFFDRMRVG